VDSPRKLSIVIPVYNEAFTIRRVVQAALEAALPAGIGRELILVDDGSVDGTVERLGELAGRPELRVVRLATNQGKGAAIRAGIPHATGSWILIQDGDLEYDPSCYSDLVAPLAEGRAQVVYGSRFLGTIGRMAWPYRAANRMLVAWTNLLYGTAITDEATAYKAFEAEILRRAGLRCRRFEFCPEITGKLARNGIPIHEVPVRYLGRTRAQGKKIRWHDALTAFRVLLRERFAPLDPSLRARGSERGTDS
jgi:glycosyltransferase involved in cell wall biosynthesis